MGEDIRLDNPEGPSPDQTPPGTPGATPDAGQSAGQGSAGQGAQGRSFTPEEHAEFTRAKQEAAESRRQLEEAQRIARESEIAAAEARAALETATKLRGGDAAPQDDGVSDELDKHVRKTRAYQEQERQNAELRKQLAEQSLFTADLSLRAQPDRYPLYAKDPDIQRKVLDDIRRSGVRNPQLVDMIYRNHAAEKLAAENAELRRQLAAKAAAPEIRSELGATDVGTPSRSSGGAEPEYEKLPTAEKASALDEYYRQRGLK